MKNVKIFEADDGSTWKVSWGYCHQNNARMLGYAANILAAVLGLVLLCMGRKTGLYVAVAVGVSFGYAWVAESFGPGRPRLWAAAVGGAAGATMAAYALALVGA